MRAEIELVLKKIKEMHSYGEKVVNVWKSSDLTLSDSEYLEVIQQLSQESYIFPCLDLIAFLLPNAISQDEIIEVVYFIAEKIKHDMAQGPFIIALISIGENNPNRSVELYNLIMKKYSHLYGYGGFLLGGAARSNSRLLDQIKREITSKTENECASLIRAIRVAYIKITFDNDLFSILNELKKHDNQNIKQEIILSYFDFYNHDKKLSFINLKLYSHSDKIDLRFTLIDQCIKRELDIKHYLQLAEILADDEEDLIISRVSMLLASKCKKYPKFCLKIIKKWIDKGKFRSIKNISWLLNEVGRENLGESLSVVKDWLYFKDYRYKFYIGEIFWDLGSNNLKLLTTTLLCWIDESAITNSILEVLRKIFQEIYKQESNEEILIMCLNKLIKMSDAEELNTIKIIKRENELIFKCTALIESIIDGKQKINYDKIFAKDKIFPNIFKWYDIKWFEQQKNNNEYEHPILQMLGGINNRYKNYEAILNHLENMLSHINPSEHNSRNIRRGLKHFDQFWQTISEIEVITRLRKNFDIEIEPSVEVTQEENKYFKKPDLKIKSNSHDVLIEVISPQMYAPLKYFHAAGIPNRLRNKVYTEFKDHFMGLNNPSDILIIIDTSHSEIRYDSADSYLGGSYSLTVRLNKESGGVIDTFPSRAQDSMDELDSDTRSIIGLILYKRKYGTDNTIHLAGRTFPNKIVMNKQRDKMLDDINNAFLG